MKTKVSASVGVVVVVAAAIAGGVGLTSRSSSATADDVGAERAATAAATPTATPTPTPITNKPANITLTVEDGATYYLGNGACTEGSADTRDSTVRLFPLKDVGNGSCASLLRWTLQKQSADGTYYYITPDSFQGHYLTVDRDAPAAVTARSQQWKALPQPNGTWVIQAADTSGGPRCLAAPPDGADAYDPLLLQPCNPSSASQGWTIEVVKWKADK